jgi:hypothetical protein
MFKYSSSGPTQVIVFILGWEKTGKGERKKEKRRREERRREKGEREKGEKGFMFFLAKIIKLFLDDVI